MLWFKENNLKHNLNNNNLSSKVQGSSPRREFKPFLSALADFYQGFFWVEIFEKTRVFEKLIFDPKPPL